MKIKRRTYNPNHIKSKRTYTFAEIAEVYHLHPGTPQCWQKEGLKPIDDSTKPFYFLGKEIIRFLKERQRQRKHPLKPDEFYCIFCRTQRQSQPGKLSLTPTNKQLGKNARQVFINGVCEKCGRLLTMFSSDQKIKKMIQNKLISSELEVFLLGSVNSSLNIDISEVKNNESKS